jgi:murein DD-endopeptidase MepM/ murein hydrolase activator NlpD
VRNRLLAAAVLVAVAAAALASAAPAQAPAKAEAAAATGTLGRVARVRASGGESSSRSIPAKLPEGIAMSDGLVSVTTESGGKAVAQAEAYDLELLGGVVSASIVSRTATGTTKGTRYRGTVLDLVVGEREIGEVNGTKTYRFDAGTVVVNKDGAGLRLELTDDYEGFPAGTSVVIADVSATRGAAPAPTATASPEPTAEPSATPEPSPEPTATPRPRSTRPSYRKRLMSNRFVFPVAGRTTIGGPFGSFRQIGAHQGNDLFADFGTPVVAAAAGVLSKVGSLPISGNRLWLEADGGDEFFYAHMASFSPAAVNDRRVEKGTILGYVGNTGDAEPTPPHLHFEIHPNGGDAVDPEPFLVAWQKRAGAALADTAERPGALVEVRDFIGEG